jgi:hypothetical protein
VKQLRYRRVITIAGIRDHNPGMGDQDPGIPDQDPGIGDQDPGIGDHDRPESAIRMARNTQQHQNESSGVEYVSQAPGFNGRW